MKNLLLSGLILAISLGTSAQTDTANQRLRIASERAVLESAFSAQESACYQKFMVNDCLDMARLRRANGLADLRRQEILLDDAQRKSKGAAQVQKTEDKAAPEKQQEAADKRADALKDSAQRQERQRQTAVDRAAIASKQKVQPDAQARLERQQDKAAGRSIKQTEAAAQVKKYNEKLATAQERQASHARSKASQSNPAAAALPTPE